MSGEFRESRCSLPIHLHPSRLANVREGVEEHINALLMKYEQIRHNDAMTSACRQQRNQPTSARLAARLWHSAGHCGP